jgi:hypothetical protein
MKLKLDNLDARLSEAEHHHDALKKL